MKGVQVVRIARTVGGYVWRFAKSENALSIIKVAAAFAALVHSVEELRKSSRGPIGFKR